MKKENNYYGLNIKINSNNIFNNFNITTEKALKIKIKNKEYEINDQNLVQLLISLIMANGGINIPNKKNTNFNLNKNEYREFCTLKKNLFAFPKELDKNTLELFIYLLSSNLEENPNVCIYIRKLINICIYFQLYDVIEKEVNEYLIPKISKYNCIEIVLNFIDLIFDKKTQNYFIDLIKKAIFVISLYLSEFINNKKESLFLLSTETLEEIIDIFFENKNKYYPNWNTDEEEKEIMKVFELLMYIRNIQSDIFSLLENERKNALKNFEMSFNEDKDFKPKFIWKIKYCDIKNEIYQEYKICINNINLLLISYYEPTKDTYQLALQIVGINSNISDNKNKDIKYLMKNASSSKKDKEKELNENNKENELNIYDNVETCTKINANDNSNLFLNDIISILYSCEIPEIGFRSKINFNCVQHTCRSKFLVFKLDNFGKLINIAKNNNSNKTIDFSIKFFFSRNYIFSSIINHICKNLEIYHKYYSVNKIPKLALSIILKNDNIINSSKNECYKLQLVKNWLRGKNNYNEQNIMDLLKFIKWSNLSTNDLVEFFITNAKLLLLIKEIKNDIFYEIQRRFQNEYFNIFQNDKILSTNLYNNTDSNTESIKLNNIPKNDLMENNNSFTFDFLTKILSYFSMRNIQNTVNNDFPSRLNYKEINFTTPHQEGRNMFKLVSQRNNNSSNYNEIPKPKASKSIRLNETPYNSINNNQNENFKENKFNNLVKRNTYTNNNNNNSKLSIPNNNSSKFYNLTNNKKKSSNSSIISNYNNNSSKNCEINERLIRNLVKKNKLNNNKNISHNKIYLSEFKNLVNLNGGKSSSLIVSKSSNRIINKKTHSKSMDRNIYDGSIHKNSSIPEKNSIYYLNDYLNCIKSENGQKQNNKEKNINGLQKNNYISKEDKDKINKFGFNGNNNHSKAKLIKSFNSPFSSKKRIKKNTSENKTINAKTKRYN